MADSNKIATLGGFVWSVAEILRGDLKQSEYGRVVLPFVVLRRLDCVLAPTKADVIAALETLPEGIDDATRDLMLCEAAGEGFTIYNVSPFTFESLAAQSAGQLHKNLLTYIAGFSPNVRDIFLEKFGFAAPAPTTEAVQRLRQPPGDVQRALHRSTGRRGIVGCHEDRGGDERRQLGRIGPVREERRVG